MCALHSPQPQGEGKNSLKEIAQLLERQMEQMSLPEAERNACAEALPESVKKMETSGGKASSK